MVYSNIINTPTSLLLILIPLVLCFIFPAYITASSSLLHQRKHPAFFFQLKKCLLESLLLTKRFHKYSTALYKISTIHSSDLSFKNFPVFCGNDNKCYNE